MRKNFGFTLAEVMIVVAIIGVVAALTIPNIVTKYQKEAQVTQIKKIAMDIEQVVDEITTIEGKTSFESTKVFKDDEGLSLFLANLSSTNVDCGEDGENCFASQYKPINGDSEDFTCSGTAVQLSNSASICAIRRINVSWEPLFNKYASLRIAAGGMATPIGGGIGGGIGGIGGGIGGTVKPDILNAKISYMELFVDTNGKAAPNVGGRDMFKLYVKTDGTMVSVKPVASNKLSTKCTCTTLGAACVCPDNTPTASVDTCTSSAFGEHCYGVLSDNDWDMDY